MNLREKLEFRARLIARMRLHLTELGAIEVETPTLLVQTIAHPNTRLFQVHPKSPDAPSTLFLQPSPELAMRALVAEGAGHIFQICRAYRDETADAIHSSEFTLLEWYWPGRQYRELEEALCGLVSAIVSRPRRTVSCADLFAEAYGAPLHELEEGDLARLYERVFGEGAVGIAGAWFDALLGKAMAPHLAGVLLTIFDYPRHDPCFGRLNDAGIVERFELFLDGVEIANGYREIESAREFRKRFEHENEQRVITGEGALPDIAGTDIPPCSGVALGLDRLIAISFGDHQKVR